MKPSDLLGAAVMKTAANLVPRGHRSPLRAAETASTAPRITAPRAPALPTPPAPRATQSFAPTPVLLGPSRATRMKAYDAPIRRPTGDPGAPVPPVRPYGPPMIPAAPPAHLGSPLRPERVSLADLLSRLGVGTTPGTVPMGPWRALGSRAGLPEFSMGTVASTAASGAAAGVAGVAAKNLVDQRAAVPGPPDHSGAVPAAAPDGPPLLPDLPPAPRYDPLDGVPV